MKKSILTLLTFCVMASPAFAQEEGLVETQRPKMERHRMMGGEGRHQRGDHERGPDRERPDFKNMSPEEMQKKFIERIQKHYEEDVEQINANEKMPDEMKQLVIKHAAENRDLHIKNIEVKSKLKTEQKTEMKALVEKLKKDGKITGDEFEKDDYKGRPKHNKKQKRGKTDFSSSVKPQ